MLKTLYNRAFTLVELLVVIAIISVLAAMLMPALEQALAASYSIDCVSSQRQLFLSFQLYFEDYDDNMFVAFSEGVHGGSGIQWYQEKKIGSYLGLSDPPAGTTRPQGALACPAAEYDDNRSNFGVVRDIFGSDWGQLYYNAKYWRRPWLKVCTYDTKQWYTWAPFAAYSPASFTVYNGKAGAAEFRHQNGHNLIFLDGHGKWYPADPDDVNPTTGWRYRGGLPDENLLTQICFNNAP